MAEKRHVAIGESQPGPLRRKHTENNAYRVRRHVQHVEAVHVQRLRDKCTLYDAISDQVHACFMRAHA